MVRIADRLGNAVDSICIGCIDAGITIKKGFLIAGERSSRAMWEVYGLEGFEKFSKAAIANLRAISLIPGVNGVFDQCLKSLEGQKDLIYGTLVFSSTADFIKVTRDSEGKITNLNFQLPKIKERNANGDVVENIDFVKLCYGIGNFFETGKFLQKYKVYAFPLFSQAANRIGSTKAFIFFGPAVSDVPVLNCWTTGPKDFFVFFASTYSTYKCFKNPDFWSAENLVKLTGNIGKMVLISSAGYMLKNKYLITLTIVDVATQNASLISLIWRREREREKRFNDPTSF